MSFAMSVSGLGALLFLFVPAARVTHTLPSTLTLVLNCTSNNATIAVRPPYECDYKTSESVIANFNDCLIKCLLPSNNANENYTDYTTQYLSSEIIRNVTYQKNVTLIVDEEHVFTRENACFEIKKEFDRPAYITNQYDTDQDMCWFECDIEANSTQICSNKVYVEVRNPGLTIAVYVGALMLQQVMLISCLPLFEGATVAIVLSKKGDLGFQKLFANLGKLIMSPIAGVLIDSFSTEEESNFGPAIYMYCVINIMSAITICFIDLTFKKKAKKITKEFVAVLKSFEVITFLFICFAIGTANGILDTFLFWLLEDLGASKSLMGITVTVGSLFGAFILLFSTKIINFLGEVYTLNFGIFFFAIRLVGYSLISNPWWAMPFEALECFSIALFSVAMASYTAILSTPTTLISLQGICMGLMHGVGRAIGSLVGGFLTKSIGIKGAYQVVAGFCVLVSIIYCLLNYFVFTKKPKLKNPENINVTEGHANEGFTITSKDA